MGPLFKNQAVEIQHSHCLMQRKGIRAVWYILDQAFFLTLVQVSFSNVCCALCFLHFLKILQIFRGFDLCIAYVVSFWGFTTLVGNANQPNESNGPCFPKLRIDRYTGG